MVGIRVIPLPALPVKMTSQVSRDSHVSAVHNRTNESEWHYQAMRSIVTLSSLNSPLYILDEGFFLREITAAEQTNYNRVMD